MLKASLKNPVLRRRARQFGRLLRHSAVTPRTGRSYKPRLVSNGELGLTFIGHADRKSTRLNSSHSQISYAVFCLKKKKNNTNCLMKAHIRSTTTMRPSD